MNAKLIWAMLPVAATIAGCSSDTESHTPSDLKSIQFSVTVPKAPRNAVTTETINTFNTCAFAEDGQLYLSNVEVVKDSETNQWGYSPTAYWPADGTLNFYSYSPALESVAIRSAENPDIANFTSPGNIDLLYGVNMNVDGKVEKQVNINFRHALSQIRFYIRKQPASETGKEIKVTVNDVKVVNVATAGSFNFPRETTSANPSTDASVGKWITTTDNGDINILNNTPKAIDDKFAEYNSTGNIFGIPQELTPTTATETTYSGSYIKVLCKITDPETGITLWPSKSDPNYVDDETGGYMVFPLVTDNNNSWEIGKLYRYNLTIGVPESAGRINFCVTVDEYNDFSDLPLEN